MQHLPVPVPAGVHIEKHDQPYPRQTGEAGDLIAYDASGNVVDFERADGTDFVYCRQQYVASLDIHLYGMVYTYKANAQGDIYWPGKGSNDDWPHKLTCQGDDGTDSFVAEVILLPALTVAFPKVSVAPANGYSITMPNDPAREMYSIYVKQQLTPGLYVTGDVDGLQGGSNWAGVKAYIEEAGNKDYITYAITAGANDGSGSFTISRNGSNITSPFTFTRP